MLIFFSDIEYAMSGKRLSDDQLIMNAQWMHTFENYCRHNINNVQQKYPLRNYIKRDERVQFYRDNVLFQGIWPTDLQQFIHIIKVKHRAGRLHIPRYGDLFLGIIVPTAKTTIINMRVGVKTFSDIIRIPLGVRGSACNNDIALAKLFLLANRASTSTSAVIRKLPREIAQRIARLIATRELTLLYMSEVGALPLISLQYSDTVYDIIDDIMDDDIFNDESMDYLAVYMMAPSEKRCKFIVHEPYSYKDYTISQGFMHPQ